MRRKEETKTQKLPFLCPGYQGNDDANCALQVLLWAAFLMDKANTEASARDLREVGNAWAFSSQLEPMSLAVAATLQDYGSYHTATTHISALTEP